MFGCFIDRLPSLAFQTHQCVGHAFLLVHGLRLVFAYHSGGLIRWVSGQFRDRPITLLARYIPTYPINTKSKQYYPHYFPSNSLTPHRLVLRYFISGLLFAINCLALHLSFGICPPHLLYSSWNAAWCASLVVASAHLIGLCLSIVFHRSWRRWMSVCWMVTHLFLMSQMKRTV